MMTFSPVGKILTRCFVSVYCSAINGETLLLMPPVPDLNHQYFTLIPRSRLSFKLTKSDDNHRGDESWKSKSMLNGNRERCEEEDKETCTIEYREYYNGVVFPKPLIGTYSTQYRREILCSIKKVGTRWVRRQTYTPKLEEICKSSGTNLVQSLEKNGQYQRERDNQHEQ
jgi:hypothetical protein